MTLKVGDKITRIIGGKLEMPMEIESIEDGVITCSAIEKDGSKFLGGWTFDEKTGVEIDDDLGWGPKYGVIGSYLKFPEKD